MIQINKLSPLVSITFARLIFNERLTPKTTINLAMIVAGTALVAMYG